ncbi:uncharacterized protein LOC134223755 [Armigeres subalbatus]|uniref:uncharacterized protein LOC134223755 n=1 Tax=Armigeres subalbatus TaxID=124917 RepID=UPI002ECFBBA4
MTKSTYGIIGAGLAGVNAARHALDAGGEVTVFEQTSKVGGTWVYTDETGKDKYGLDIHTSMYQGLRTNIPKEIMGFPDFPIGQQEESYVTSQDVLKFIENYTEEFDLNKYIKFEHHVIRVTRKMDCEKWEVLVKDLRANRYESYLFDYILVCNGHFFSPFTPKIVGHETFKGEQMHSHEYRSPARFAGKNVVVIGGSHSGMDVAIAAAPLAKELALSHRCSERLNIFYDKVVQKPEIARIYENEVEFVDGTRQICDVLVYCTGYRTSFPFLSVDCGITVEENHVQPLYKHCINIRQPSMALIGLPFNACFTLMVDLQVRFCIKFFSGGKSLPTQEEMAADTRADEEERAAKGFIKREAHMLAGDLQQRYYDDLACIADVEPLRPVLTKLYAVCIQDKKRDIMNYRSNVYRILDNDTFIKVN